MEKRSPTDDAPRSDEQQEHERDAERLMLQQEAEHLAHAKYRDDSEAGLDRRRVAVPDLAKSRSWHSRTGVLAKEDRQQPLANLNEPPPSQRCLRRLAGEPQ